jgi:hypothetical protein
VLVSGGGVVPVGVVTPPVAPPVLEPEGSPLPEPVGVEGRQAMGRFREVLVFRVADRATLRLTLDFPAHTPRYVATPAPALVA